MSTQTLGSNAICQVAVIVKDVERAAKAVADVFGLPVPQVIVSSTLEHAHTLYRGKPTEGRVKMAFFQMGTISLEMMEPFNGPSIWQEHLDKHGESVHHIAFRVDGMKEALAVLDGKGMPLLQSGDFGTGCYAYVDSIPKLGVMLELLEIYPQKA